MKLLSRLFLSSSLSVLFLPILCAQTTFTWNGDSGNWSETTNWTPNGVPASTDDVLITAEGTYSVTMDVDVSINNLTIGGSTGIQTLTLSDRILTIAGEAIVNSTGALSITSSTIAGSGTLSNQGALTTRTVVFDIGFDNANLATMYGRTTFNDTIITQENSEMTLRSYSNVQYVLISAKGFANKGLLHCRNDYVQGGGSIIVTDGTLTNDAEGSLHFAGYNNYYSCSLQAPLDNMGSITLDKTLVLNKPSAAHYNSGTITLALWDLTITQTGDGAGFVNTGTITIDNLRTLKVTGGDINIESGMILNNGLLSIVDGTVHMPPAYIHTGEAKLENCILNLPSTLTNQGSLTLYSTTINGSGFFTNEDTLTTRTVVFEMGFNNANLATMYGSTAFNDTLITQENSTMTLRSYSNVQYALTSAKGFTNKGLIHCRSDYVYNGGKITVSDGTLINAAEASMHFTGYNNYYSSSINAPLDNKGSITIDRTLVLNKPSAIHYNSGTISLALWGLTITQTGDGAGFVNTGTISIDSLRILKVTGGDFNTESGIFLKKGTVSAVEAIIHLPDVFTNVGSFSLDESILNCASSLTNQGSFTAYDTEINGSGFFTNDSTLTTRTVVFNMGLDNTGLATMSGHSTFNDTLITQPSSTMTVRNYSNVPYRFDPVKGFVNKGLMNCITSYSNYYGGGQLTSSEGMLINDVGGTINFAGGESSYYSGMYAPMVNHGEITVSHNTRFSHASAVFINWGSINVLPGWKLEFQGTSFSNQTGGLLMGGGTIDVEDLTFSNSGIIAPGASPGRLYLTGTLPQDASSEIDIELGGKEAGVSYDQLAVSGAAALDGTLNVELVDDFVPELGDVFEVVSFSSVTGDFVDINGLYTGHGVILNAAQTATSVTLNTTAHTNRMPVVERPIADLVADEDFDMITVALLDSIFSDEDISLGDELTFSCSSSGDLITFSLEDHLLTLYSMSDSNGVDSIFIDAMDIDQTTASDTIVFTINPVNDPPSDFDLLEPLNMQVLSSLDTILFSWNSASDVEEDPLIYTLHLYHPSWDTTVNSITDTSHLLIANASLPYDTEFQWTLFVTDGSETVHSSDTLSFTTKQKPVGIPNSGVFSGFSLGQNYPNPFGQETMITFSIPREEKVNLKIYDLNGRLIAILVSESLESGEYTVRWNAVGMSGGVYLYRLDAGKFQKVRRMILSDE